MHGQGQDVHGGCFPQIFSFHKGSKSFEGLILEKMALVERQFLNFGTAIRTVEVCERGDA